jgi:hypothetical protein
MRGVFTLVAVSGLLAASAGAATNPELTHLQNTLKASMVTAFKKQAPSLKITTVTCKLPTNGTTAHCKANFTAGTVKGYYPVAATILASGKLKWTASSPKCFNAKTGKAISCSG